MIAKLFMLGFSDRKGVFLGLLIVTLFFASGLPRWQVDTGVNSLIPANDPARIIYQRVANEFGTDNKTIIYIRDSQLWTPDKLGKLQLLHEAIEKTAHVTRVDSLYSLHTIDGSDGKINTKPVLKEAPRTLEEAQEARASALANPLYAGNFFSDDGSVTAMIVSVENIEDEQNFSRSMYHALEQLLSEYRPSFEYLVQVGPPRINAELKSSLYEDFILLGPLSALILVLAIMFFTRSGLSALIPLVTAALTIVWTFGMLGWTGIPINILSAMLPSLIIVIGSTEDTHLMAAFFRGLSVAENEPRREAVKYMASHIGLPMILTVLTTALGFASNMFSDIGLIQHFAIASTFAMITNGMITLLVVPLLLSLFGPNKVRKAADNETRLNLPGKMIEMFRYCQQHFPGAILLITALLCLFFIYQASTLYVTNDPLSYFPSDRPLIRDTQRIHKDLAGIKDIFYKTWNLIKKILSRNRETLPGLPKFRHL